MNYPANWLRFSKMCIYSSPWIHIVISFAWTQVGQLFDLKKYFMTNSLFFLRRIHTERGWRSVTIRKWCGRTESTLHSDIQHLRDDDPFQRDQRAKSSRSAERIFGGGEKSPLLKHLAGHVRWSGESLRVCRVIPFHSNRIGTWLSWFCHLPTPLDYRKDGMGLR